MPLTQSGPRFWQSALPLPGELGGRARPVLGVAEMAAADQAAAAAGRPGLVLMEAAGAAVVREIAARWSKRPVRVLCGPGNNGGDGYVIARLLAARGWPVRVMALEGAPPPGGDAAGMAHLWRGRVDPMTAEDLRPGDLVVDALFGAGLSRPLAGAAAEAVARINALGLTCVGVDVPSGVDGDSGRILGAAPFCALTVTFFHPKPGHLLVPARERIGELVIADIGLPETVLDAAPPRAFVNGPGLWTLPRPAVEGHKFARGHAVVIGGARMTGAARLAARACRRVGAGLLTIACAEEARLIYALDQPGAMVWGIGGEGPIARLLDDPRRNAFLLGPGYGRGAETAALALMLAKGGRALVLDADALTSLSGKLEEFSRTLCYDCVLTPHEGEFRALFAAALGAEAAPERGRLARARAAARASGAVVVLKGPDTVIAAADGRAAISVGAPADLATAGSGDVLAGLVLGLLAQGLPGFEAAAAAVWLHGAAGRAAGPGLIAEDLPEALPALLAALRSAPSPNRRPTDRTV
ncbi:conserved hypothetical protein [Rhodospirillum rubrum ATCC 11170]|uniref:Bifunctional NAD(P)H-hydrate repair enzyme n=5 Tax=Rhodospirillum rubrum TaxID=1085 RepID=Q2RU48_RHORT|nr:bifunctional ADP-dependent NAD(P)H-hydrate dehydratase/NAD(P)H-hydrate epimerase [Rhodospirillum rubrum]ABC22347.1 conserved hypothetical protein [Rhodospirillum rubrum ATCC 11170]MBK5953927.1 bifunctional ADP-dependent NAD(P)H-hydrate dehydratase/NAD(P)H-hydrate epimerase [Rhodospirillum rubrum]QXG81986.1 bifunctional ADP-dependent NAD(P)H-hydrate dehydratase/NAD(P)H-hydrate epimerase [Rhodospirillum rubrum]